MMKNKLLIIDVAALGFEFLVSRNKTSMAGMEVKSMESLFPALTSTVQASFRTALQPDSHGMISNGLYFRDLCKVMFWEQSAGLVKGHRFWEPLRESGGEVAMLFWQQSLGECVDMVLSPAPVHKHGGGMISGCISNPPELETAITGKAGSRFPLHRYWGPLASAKAGDWIVNATSSVISGSKSPELVMTYLPTLDYDLQRFGPDHPKATDALCRLISQLDTLVQAASSNGYQTLFFGDYAIGPVAGEAIFMNRILKNEGLLAVRNIGNMEYVDLHHSRAVAVADHEIAHVYVSDPKDIPQTLKVLSGLDGVLSVNTSHDSLYHPNSGELIAIAAEGRWFAYPWWDDRNKAPDFASHVDIHSKPGFDPCELFFGRLPWKISTDTGRIAGSHGRSGIGREVAYGATFDIGTPASIIELSNNVSQWITGEMC